MLKCCNIISCTDIETHSYSNVFLSSVWRHLNMRYVYIRSGAETRNLQVLCTVRKLVGILFQRNDLTALTPYSRPTFCIYALNTCDTNIIISIIYQGMYGRMKMDAEHNTNDERRITKKRVVKWIIL